MKLYSYSSELYTFVQAKWAKPKFATVGILIGIIIFFAFIKLNQSVGIALGSRTANSLAAQNDFLRQEIRLISLQVTKLEMRARQLNEHANKLHMLLHPRKIVGGTVSRFAYATEGFKLQSQSPVATSFRP